MYRVIRSWHKMCPGCSDPEGEVVLWEGEDPSRCSLPEHEFGAVDPGCHAEVTQWQWKDSTGAWNRISDPREGDFSFLLKAESGLDPEEDFCFLLKAESWR